MSEHINVRVSGHTLRFEGRAYTDEGKVIDPWSSDAPWRGRGMCSCGTMSDVLNTRAERKRWHREHKAEVLRAQEERS